MTIDVFMEQPKAEEAGTALVVIEKSTALDVYKTPGGIDPYLQRIAAEVKGFAADASTAKGREAIRSMAYRVTRSKTYLDDLGKKLADDLKDIPKKIDANRRAARDFLENLAADVRKPLTAWEEEQRRVEAAAKAKAEAEAMAVRVEQDHEVALLLNAEFDRLRDERKRAEEAAIVERERLAREEGERRAREESERRVIEAKLATERAEREKVEAQEREAKAVRESAERAERAKAEAIEQERKRVEEQQRQQAAEKARREADVQHRKAVNRKALADVQQHCGLTDEQGKAVITAIVEGKISGVTITY